MKRKTGYTPSQKLELQQIATNSRDLWRQKINQFAKDNNKKAANVYGAVKALYDKNQKSATKIARLNLPSKDKESEFRLPFKSVKIEGSELVFTL